MAKNLVAGETTKINESGANISVELTDTMKNKINSIPSISIGTTTTGEAGTDASVSNSGTSTNMVLNFTIPKGANGQDGEDGQDGIGFTTASAGTPTQSDGYTVTPITFNKTDGSNVVVNVSAKNGLDGSGGTSVLVIEATDENNALTLSSQNPNNIYFWEE